MGEVTVVAYAALALVGISLVGVGAVRRSRGALVAGAALLMALLGAWTIGLPGLALGVIPLAFLKRRP